MRYWILPLALAMIHAGVSEVDVHSQSRGVGECSIEADLVELDGGWVTLRTTGGKLIDLPAAKLSRADQRWVRTHVPLLKKPARPRRATCRTPARA